MPCRRRGLGHHGADQVVGQDVRPHLLAHQLRRLAPQLAHLHRRLDRPQVELVVPPRPVQRRQVLLGRLLRVQQRRHHHDRLGPEARLQDPEPHLPDRDRVRQRVVRLPVQRADRRRLGPADEWSSWPSRRPRRKSARRWALFSRLTSSTPRFWSSRMVAQLADQAVGQEDVAGGEARPTAGGAG